MVSSLGRPTFGGLATGLDTSALLEGLLAIERQPLSRIRARRAEIDNQRGLMRQLNTRLVALREAAQKLDNRNSAGTGAATSEEFLRYSGSSTNEDVVTVSAGTGAAPGDIDVIVNALATSSREGSISYTAQAASTALLAGQSLTIDLPNGDPNAVPPVAPTSITVTATAGDLSLENIRDQINTSADNVGAVRADILRVADDDLRLVLTSTGTGTSNQLSVTGDLTLDPALSQTATNASINIFGQDVSRDTNVIDDLLAGITLRLEGPSEMVDDGLGGQTAAPETVTVAVDTEEVAGALEEFTKAYNDVMSFIESQFSYNEATETSGPLAGDFTLRRVQSQLRAIVSSGYSFEQSPGNPFAPTAGGSVGGSISNIGIELEAGGRLSVNREKLDEALALDPRAVSEFLSGRDRLTADPNDANDFYDEGFAQRITVELDELVRSGDGALAERDRAFADRLRDFDDSIERFETRLAQREESLILRFSELERIVAGLQSQQGFLTGIGQ